MQKNDKYFVRIDKKIKDGKIDSRDYKAHLEYLENGEKALLKRFPQDLPATSRIIANGLSEPEWLIEIEAEAIINPRLSIRKIYQLCYIT